MKVPCCAALLFLAVLAFPGETARAQDSYFGSHTPAGAKPVVTLTPSPTPTPVAKPPAEFSAKDIKIVTSVWGAEHKFVEVTDRLTEALSHPDAEHEIGIDWLGDPAPTWKKVLVTVFEVKGKRYTMGNHEGIKLNVRKFQDYVQNMDAPTGK